MEVQTIDAAAFKEQCPALLDRLGPAGLVITRHGKPVARVLPYETTDADLIGRLRERVEVTGEIMSTNIRWNADRQP